VDADALLRRADENSVVIYRGIQQDLGPISLSTPYEDTGICSPICRSTNASRCSRRSRARSPTQQIVDTLRTSDGRRKRLP
jgi:protein phosphatase